MAVTDYTGGSGGSYDWVTPAIIAGTQTIGSIIAGKNQSKQNKFEELKAQREQAYLDSKLQLERDQLAQNYELAKLKLAQGDGGASGAAALSARLQAEAAKKQRLLELLSLKLGLNKDIQDRRQQHLFDERDIRLEGGSRLAQLATQSGRDAGSFFNNLMAGFK